MQESHAVADAIVKFDGYQNLQRHCAVLPAIARLLFLNTV